MITGFITFVIWLVISAFAMTMAEPNGKNDKHRYRKKIIALIVSILFGWLLMWWYLKHWESLVGFYIFAFIIISFIGVMTGAIGGRK